MPLLNAQTGSFSVFCIRCSTIHSIDAGNSERYCHNLIKLLNNKNTLALGSTSSEVQAKFSTTSLFGPARGKMFGVMECRADDGSVRTLRAFSGQYNGCWIIDGWCPPLFDVPAFEILTSAVEKKIENLGSIIKDCDKNSAIWLSCKRQRKALSQRLMREIHELYELHNFNGEKLKLPDLFGPEQGIPTGTGDCCAPKLLNYAAKNNLRPLGMSEFYWGRENRSGSRQHGLFYQPCDDKCRPILGAMLCGLT